VLKIISGGQTGADRAALDWAIARGLLHGGWCPAGRKAEDGRIDTKYNLTETESAKYDSRTQHNVRDSDATLIVNLGELEGGTLKTLRAAERLGKPVHVIQLDAAALGNAIDAVREWLRAIGAESLNVAGPRESKRPGIYQATLALLNHLYPA
jgi:hypothetical protein